MARKTLAERLQDLERRKARLKAQTAHLERQTRKQHNASIFVAGQLLEKAGLLDQAQSSPDALLAGLMELAERLKRPMKPAA